MMSVLSIAMVIAMLTAAFILLRWPTWVCEGDNPLPRLTFLAILFTSGLDVGLIMFPLVDFQAYATESDYSFANPLAIEFGFWGGLVWSFYFLTTIYFCALEPKLRLFELPLVKLIHNLVIIKSSVAVVANRGREEVVLDVGRLHSGLGSDKATGLKMIASTQAGFSQ